MSETAVKELRERMSSLEGCCLERAKDAAGIRWEQITRILASAWSEYGGWQAGLAESTDSSEVALAELDDGRVMVFEGSEDYTGHG